MDMEEEEVSEGPEDRPKITWQDTVSNITGTEEDYEDDTELYNDDDDDDDEFSTCNGRYKLEYQYVRKPLSPVDFDEEGIDEAINRAKSLSKRLASAFQDECGEVRRSSRRHDRVALNYLSDFVSDIHSGVSRSFAVTDSKKFPSADSDEDEEVKRLFTRKTRNYVDHEPSPQAGRKNYWWRDQERRDLIKESEDSKLTVREKRNRIEEKLNGILDYEIPMNKNYSSLRNSIREIEEKLDKHRRLTDRYVGVDMNEKELTAEERINKKAEELIKRLPYLAPSSHRTSNEDTSSTSTLTSMGFTSGLTNKDSKGTAELRGRLRRLLCRTKNNPNYYRH